MKYKVFNFVYVDKIHKYYGVALNNPTFEYFNSEYYSINFIKNSKNDLQSF